MKSARQVAAGKPLQIAAKPFSPRKHTLRKCFRKFQRYKNIPFSFPFDINLSFTLSAQEFCQKMTKKKVLVLKNEDMHSNLKSEMKKLCKWLNIRFNKSLLHSTSAGKKWMGESSYLGKGELNKQPPKNYYKPINIEARWRNFLDKNTILIIEAVYEKIMIQNKYKFDNKLNEINAIANVQVAFSKKSVVFLAPII